MYGWYGVSCVHFTSQQRSVPLQMEYPSTLHLVVGVVNNGVQL